MNGKTIFLLDSAGSLLSAALLGTGKIGLEQPNSDRMFPVSVALPLHVVADGNETRTDSVKPAGADTLSWMR